MPKAKQISIDLLTEVIKCSNLLGEKQTILTLKQAQFTTQQQRDISNIIIDTTCKHIRVSRAQALDGSTRGDRPIAMMIILILHKHFLNYREVEIASLFSKHIRVINKWVTYFNRLSDKHRADAATLKKFNEISASIEKQI